MENYENEEDNTISLDGNSFSVNESMFDVSSVRYSDVASSSKSIEQGLSNMAVSAIGPRHQADTDNNGGDDQEPYDVEWLDGSNITEDLSREDNY